MLAEGEGFEPSRACTLRAFQARALGHYAIPPDLRRTTKIPPRRRMRNPMAKPSNKTNMPRHPSSRKHGVTHVAAGGESRDIFNLCSCLACYCKFCRLKFTPGGELRYVTWLSQCAATLGRPPQKQVIAKPVHSKTSSRKLNYAATAALTFLFLAGRTLTIVRKHAVQIFIFTILSCLTSKMSRLWRFGRKRRSVFMLEWLTVWPT